MRGIDAGRSDHCPAIALVVGFREASAGSRALAPHERKWEAISVQERLERFSPGAIDRAVVGDRIADGHDFDWVSSAEIREDQLCMQAHICNSEHKKNEPSSSIAH